MFCQLEIKKDIPYYSNQTTNRAIIFSCTLKIEL